MPAKKRLAQFVPAGLNEHKPAMTFGIELEVLVVCPPNAFASELSEDYKECPISMICTLLARAGIRTTKCHGGSAEDKAYATWHIGRDDSLELTEAEESHCPDGYATWEVELASRKMALDGEDWQAEIGKVIDCIQSLENYGCIVLTNQTCGFHVHVGYGSSGISLNTAKNVYELSTALERCFDELHTTSRIVIGDGFQTGEHFNAPLGWLHTHNIQHADDIFGWCENIEMSQTVEELGELMRCNYTIGGKSYITGGHFSTLNFDNLFVNGQDSKEEDQLTRTIEFRQHEGSIDARTIKAWILLTTSFVQFCGSANDHQIINLVGKAFDPSFRMLDLIRAMGCPPQLYEHCKVTLFADHDESQVKWTREAEKQLAESRVPQESALTVANQIGIFKRSSRAALDTKMKQKKFDGGYGRQYSRYDSSFISKAFEACDDHKQKEKEPVEEGEIPVTGKAMAFLSFRTKYSDAEKAEKAEVLLTAIEQASL